MSSLPRLTLHYSFVFKFPNTLVSISSLLLVIIYCNPLPPSSSFSSVTPLQSYLHRMRRSKSVPSQTPSMHHLTCTNAASLTRCCKGWWAPMHRMRTLPYRTPWPIKCSRIPRPVCWYVWILSLLFGHVRFGSVHQGLSTFSPVHFRSYFSIINLGILVIIYIYKAQC